MLLRNKNHSWVGFALAREFVYGKMDTTQLCFLFRCNSLQPSWYGLRLRSTTEEKINIAYNYRTLFAVHAPPHVFERYSPQWYWLSLPKRLRGSETRLQDERRAWSCLGDSATSAECRGQGREARVGGSDVVHNAHTINCTCLSLRATLQALMWR